MKMLAQCLLAVALCFSSFVNAQTSTDDPEYVYLIQIASVPDPDPADFKNVRSLGYVYSAYSGKNLYKIMMGTFSSKSHADQKLSQVRAKGYKDAFVQKVELKEEDAVYIVQLSTLDQDDDIAWNDWLRISPDLVAQLSEAKIRIATGPYKTKTQAEEEMAKLKGKAPKDMFVKKVSSKTLHIVTDFETKGVKPTPPKPVSRTSVKMLQQFLQSGSFYKGAIDGFWGSETGVSAEAYRGSNETYLKYKSQSEKATYDKPIEEGTLQYYINLIGTKPYTADEGLKGFKHPLAKAYRAYMYLNGDMPNLKSQVNDLMNEAIQMVFGNYKGETRYDFSMKYAYDDLEQLVKHLRALHEAVKDEPDFPCWLFQRHPKIIKVAFEPHWNNERDAYTISSDCGSYFSLPEMKVLMAIAQDFAATPNEYHQNSSKLQEIYLNPTPLADDKSKELEAWNDKLWKGLETWSAGSPLQAKLYSTLRFAYYDAQRVLEDNFTAKGISNSDSRALALQVLRLSAGCSLDEYCGQ